jgi:hypothetical protein
MGLGYRIQAAKAGGPDKAGLAGDDDELDAVAEAQRCVSGPPALTRQDGLPHARVSGLLMITELLALSIQGSP